MRIYIAIKYFEDFRNRSFIEKLSYLLEKKGVQTICVVRDLEKWGEVPFSPSELMTKSFQEIDACDLVLVDLSEKGVGLGIEAGYAYAKGKPIFTIAEKNSDISSTLAGISERIFFYESVTEDDFSLMLESISKLVGK